MWNCSGGEGVGRGEWREGHRYVPATGSRAWSRPPIQPPTPAALSSSVRTPARPGSASTSCGRMSGMGSPWGLHGHVSRCVSLKSQHLCIAANRPSALQPGSIGQVLLIAALRDLTAAEFANAGGPDRAKGQGREQRAWAKGRRPAAAWRQGQCGRQTRRCCHRSDPHAPVLSCLIP